MARFDGGCAKFEGGGRTGNQGTVTFECRGRRKTVYVEVADEPAERRRGLMFREELEPEHGMLFVFPGESIRSFWMRNTKISLDLVFMNSKGEVVGIIERAEPMNDRSLSVPTPAKFVLEVKGGYCNKEGIIPGCSAKIDL